MRRFLFFVLLVLGCAGVKEKEAVYPPIEKKHPLCAVLVPYESRYRTLGEDMRDGVLLALDKLNVITYDTDADAIRAIEVAKRAIHQDGVTCIIGPLLSSTAIPVACISECAGVPMLSPMATEQGLRDIGEHIYKIYSPYDVEEVVLASYVAKELKPDKIAALAPDDSYGREMVKSFDNELGKMDMGICQVFYYTPGFSDLKDFILGLKALDADAIFVPAYESDIPAIAPQFVYYEAIGPKTVILGLREWGYPEIMKEYEGYLENVVFTSVETLEYPIMKRSFSERFGREATKSAVMGYAAGRFFALAIKDGISNREAFSFWLSDNDTIQTLPGISLSKKGLSSYVRIFCVRSGEIIRIW